MPGERDRLVPPRRKTKQRADSNSAKPGIIPALGASQPPVEILLRPGHVHRIVNRAVVSLLVNDEPFRAGLHDGAVLLGFHRRDFDGDGGEIFPQNSNALAQVIIADELRMFAGNEEQIAEPGFGEMSRFAQDFLNRESEAQDRVLAREAAVTAAVDALVREIKRREEPHGAAEMLKRERARAGGHSVELPSVLWRE